MKWFYVEKGAQQGPVSEYVLRLMRNQGKLSSGSLVWHEGMEKWESYSERIGDDLGSLPMPPVIPPEMTQGAQKDESMRYAGFWIRGAATIIDGLILAAIQVIPIFSVMFMFGMGEAMMAQGNGSALSEGFTFLMVIVCIGMWFFILFLSVAYPTFFHGKYGATFGKMALGIKVVSPTGGRISYMRAFGRAFAIMLSGMIFYIGYIMAAFDREKRSLHDMMCDTRVIYKK